MPVLTLGTITIPYAIEERPRRQHPAIQVDSYRQLTVLVPSHFPENQIEPLLAKKARWILNHVTPPQILTAMSSKQFVSGEGFLFRGHLLRLKVSTINAAHPEVTQQGRALRVNIPLVPGLQRPNTVRDVLMQWYYSEATRLLPQRLDHYLDIIGVPPERLKIAEYKSRWGFCRDDGLIALNWRIIQAPLSVMDYVVVHELMHRRYPHHRQTFWQAVEVVLPDYGVRKQWLRDHGAELGW
jgi:hypothetical protein